MATPTTATAVRVTCTMLAVCGDGVSTAGEACDDGNTDRRRRLPAATATCLRRRHPGSVDEECDDGNTMNADGCQGDCKLPFCGDGIQDSDEECDDGNNTDADSCQGDCKLPACGDGILGRG